MGVNILTVDEQPAELDDATLIEQARTNKEAFGLLYQRYVDRIYNYIYYRTGNTEDAEDLTARVFQRALIHIPKYQDKGVPFQAWLYRIASNLVSNFHRDNSRKQTVGLDEIIFSQVGDTSPELLIQMIESEGSLMEVVKSLPSERQDLLIYKFLHRMSNAEIGEVLGKSEGAVKSLYHRTLLSLRETMVTRVEREEAAEKSRFKRLKFWKE